MKRSKKFLSMAVIGMMSLTGASFAHADSEDSGTVDPITLTVVPDTSTSTVTTSTETVRPLTSGPTGGRPGNSP